jgi:hypothetical protein
MTPMSPEDMMTAVSGSLAQRTGRSLEEWVAVVQASGVDPLDQTAVRRWLRAEHGVPQNSQWAIADAAARAAGWTRPSVEEYIGGQYEGARAELRPTYTPFERRRQFAAIAAATRTRIDIGLRYIDAPASGLLSPANAPGQATHKLSLGGIDDITAEVEGLLRAAYDQNG